MLCAQEPLVFPIDRISKIYCNSSHTCAQQSRQSRRIYAPLGGYQRRKSESRQQKKPQHDEIQAHLDTTTMTIYIDGSDIENKIGAAAYIIMINEAGHQYLGNETQFNVYTAELTAVHLAIKATVEPRRISDLPYIH
jgi:hypothetical protein